MAIEGEPAPGPRISTDQHQISQENQSARDVGYVADERIEGRQPAGERQEQDGNREEQRREPKVVTSKYEDKRARMLDSARQLREDQRAQPNLAEEIAESRRNLFSENVDIPELRKPEEQRQTEPGAKRTLKVNGKDIELTEDEITAHAQRAMAADDILDGAKRDRELATELLRTAQSAIRPTPAGTPAAEEPEQTRAPKPTATAATKLPADELGKIVEQIQFGNTDEALTALQKFGEDIAERAVHTVRAEFGGEHLVSQVRNINDFEQRTAQTRTALEKIGGANPELGTDEILQAAFAGSSAAEMRKNLIAVGMNPEKLQERINSSGKPPAEAMGELYTEVSRQRALPSMADVVTKAHKAMVDRGMLKAAEQRQEQQRQEPGNSNFDPQQRIERKREIAPQPRRAGAPPSLDAQQVSRDDRNVAAVRQMRANRRGRA